MIGLSEPDSQRWERRSALPDQPSCSEIAGEYALVAPVATARFSQNLFPNGFSRNGALKMEKRDAPQTCVCVTEYLSSSIGLKRYH